MVWGYVCDHLFFWQKAKVKSDIQLNICQYNDCSIKLETKVLRLHKIRVLNISLFWLISLLCILYNL